MQATEKNIQKLLRGLLCSLLAGTLLSCSQQGDVPATPLPEADDGISVSIQLTGQRGEQTRGEDEYGTIADNYINYRDLYVMTFSLEEGRDVLTDNSQLIEVMWHPDFSTASYSGKSTVSSSGENVYLSAQLDQSRTEYQGNINFCIVAVANINSFKVSLKLSDLTRGMAFSALSQRLRANFKPSSSTLKEWSWIPDNAKGVGIPMFGVKKVNLKGYDSKIFSAWNPYELHSADGDKELKLLRAFAKVTVEFKDDFETPTGQTDVKFVSGGGIGKKYSGGFKVVPTLTRMEGFSTTGETGQISPESSIGSDLGSGLSGELTEDQNPNLQFTASADGKYAILYLPEYELNSTNPDYNPDVTVMIAFGGIPQSFNFKLKQYTAEGVETPLYWRYLLRNYSYRFIIDIEYGTITVVATEWDKTFENDFNFG